MLFLESGITFAIERSIGVTPHYMLDCAALQWRDGVKIHINYERGYHNWQAQETEGGIRQGPRL